MLPFVTIPGGGIIGQSLPTDDEEEVIERILRHLGLWEEPVDVSLGPPEPILELFPEETIIELCSDSAPWEEFPDPFPDYHSEPVFSWN